MKKYLAVLAIGVAGVIPLVGSQSAAIAQPVAHASCLEARMPDGLKCLQSGEYCSHKPGYAADYRRAGFVCKGNGRLEEI
jgi:hypothetical protein